MRGDWPTPVAGFVPALFPPARPDWPCFGWAQAPSYPRPAPSLLECVRYLFLRTKKESLTMRCAVRAAESSGAAKGLRALMGVSKSQLRQVIDPAVGAVFAVDVGDLQSETRGSPRVAFARQVAMYLAHVVSGLSLTEVGALFARDRTTVSHACSVVEDRRDDPELDGRLEHLERAVAALIDALFTRRG